MTNKKICIPDYYSKEGSERVLISGMYTSEGVMLYNTSVHYVLTSHARRLVNKLIIDEASYFRRPTYPLSYMEYFNKTVELFFDLVDFPILNYLKFSSIVDLEKIKERQKTDEEVFDDLYNMLIYNPFKSTDDAFKDNMEKAFKKLNLPMDYMTSYFRVTLKYRLNKICFKSVLNSKYGSSNDLNISISKFFTKNLKRILNENKNKNDKIPKRNYRDFK